MSVQREQAVGPGRELAGPRAVRVHQVELELATRCLGGHRERDPPPVRGPDSIPDVAQGTNALEARSIGARDVHGSDGGVEERPVRRGRGDLGPVGGPADGVVGADHGRGRPLRRQPRQAAAVRADDEQILRRAVAGLVLGVGTEEQELGTVRRGLDRQVRTRPSIGQPDQAAAVGGPPGVQAHAARIGGIPSPRDDPGVARRHVPPGSSSVGSGIGSTRYPVPSALKMHALPRPSGAGAKSVNCVPSHRT